jgi:hypothetical protein
MTDADSAYAIYREACYNDIAAKTNAARWEVRFCIPGEDDIVTLYFANEASFMCEALVTQTQLGHDTYVKWLEP